MALRTLFLLLTLSALCGACRSTPGVTQAPGQYDENGVHVVCHSSSACRVCALYRKARPYIVRLESSSGNGAGVVLTPDGKVATNAHVVGRARSVNIHTYDDHTYVGKVVATSNQDDLAVVSMRAEDRTWKVPVLRRGAPPEIGSKVYVIGRPLGLGWTVTRGTISKYYLDGMKTLIETDADIATGNSGGAMLDGEGQLLGIVTTRIDGRGAENVAFARPTEALMAFLTRLGSPESEP
jgi:S1-C subfamily serine protease